MKIRIFFLYIIFFVIVSACNHSAIIRTQGTCKVKISGKTNGSLNVLNGFITISDSSIFLNLYGPFNRNILKFYVEKDTITIIDLINMKKNEFILSDSYILLRNILKNEIQTIDKKRLSAFIKILSMTIQNEDDLKDFYELDNYWLNDKNFINLSSKNLPFYTETGISFHISNLNSEIKIVIKKKYQKKIDLFKKDKYIHFNSKYYKIND
jgi:hypothetical protein